MFFSMIKSASIFLVLCLVSFFTSASQEVLAQDNTESSVPVMKKIPEHVYGNQYSRVLVTLGSVGIDADVANGENIGDSAGSLRVGWENITDNFIWGLGFNIYAYSDRDEFSQQVSSVWGGDTSTQESDASGTALYGEVGYAYPLTDNVSADLLVGLELMVSSKRAIAYCDDCYEQDIDVSSGLYVTPRVSFHTSEKWTLGFSYQYFITGELESLPMVWATFSF